MTEHDSLHWMAASPCHQCLTTQRLISKNSL